MDLEFTGEVWWWRGPAPHHFVRVPDEDAAQIDEVAAAVTYGWGMIPVSVRLGGSTWSTSLWPKDGGYIVPLKAEVRRREGVAVGDRVAIALVIDA